MGQIHLVLVTGTALNTTGIVQLCLNKTKIKIIKNTQNPNISQIVEAKLRD